MRGLIFIVGLLVFLSVVDQIACRGQYSRMAWRETTEQADYFKHQVGYWVGRLIAV